MPIMDEFNDTKGPQISLDNLKSEFKVILDKLCLQLGISAKEELNIIVALDIREEMQNQWHFMKFYKDHSVN